MSHRFILLATLLLLLVPPVLGAQIPEGVEGTYRPHPEAEKAVSRLLSPFCPGLMLTQCPAEASRILRDSIHALALDGWNAEALEAWMLANHGEEYRAVPKRSGTGLLAWLFPPLALLAGLGVVGWALRSFVWGRKSGHAGPAGDGVGDAVGVGDPAVLAGREASNGSGSPGDLPSDEEELRLREAIRDLEFSEDPVY
jgi:cytochrome c-type biogenesis protein CcmH/NrfF